MKSIIMKIWEILKEFNDGYNDPYFWTKNQMRCFALIGIFIKSFFWGG